MPIQKRAKNASKESQPRGKTPAKSEPKKMSQPASKQRPKASKSKSPAKAITLANQAKQDQREVVYREGEFVGIVDARATNEERFDSFTLVRVKEASMKGDAQLKVIPYKQGTKANSFSQEDQDTLTIFEYQVLAAAKVKPEKKDLSTVKISQTEANKLEALFENNLETIKEKLGISDGDNDSEEAEEKKDAEPEEILTAKRTHKSVEVFSQPVRAKTALRKKKKDSDDEEEEEEEVSEALQKVGKKRAVAEHTVSQSVPRRKKLNDGTEVPMAQTQKTPRAKSVKPQKEPKWKTVLKIGKWNPQTKIVDKEIEKTWPEAKPHYECCLSCNARNIWRAINTKNAALLKLLIYDVQHIPTVNCGWSHDSQWQSLVTLIMLSKDVNLLHTAFDVDVTSFRPQFNGLGGDPEQFALTQLFIHKRNQPKEFLLNLIKQGQVSYKAYGTRIRTVEMTRGNRQGNNAFLDYEGSYNTRASMPSFDMETFEQQFFFRHLTPEFYKQLSVTKVFKSQNDYFNHQLHLIARTGNRKLLLSLVEPLLKHEMYGFNQLHVDVLKLNSLEQKYATQSLTKKATQAENVTPLHFACINPSVVVLQKMLEQNQELHVTDNNNWKPIHYAAACEGSGPLELLLKLGASTFDITFYRQTPLHIAAINGRTANIKALLQGANAKITKARDRQGNTPMYYVLKLGEIEPIQAFLDSGLVKIGSTHGKDRMTALHFAAAQGDFELCQFLLERKAKVLAKDKFKRSPLILACKNGHVKVASLLLQNGSDWNQSDSSQNYPIHYAAGYGWLECINLLVDHGVNLNSNNMWKVTPITIAMLKNHTGIVKELMKHEGVDVNGKDDKGLTLLHMACADLSKWGIVDFVKYLLDKGADPNLADLEGQTPLHNLAFYRSAVRQKRIAKVQRGQQELVDNDYQDSLKAEQKARLQVIDLLIQYKANLNATTNDGDTPFSIALKQNEISVLHKFVENVKLSESPQLFHHFTNHILDQRYYTLLIQLIQKEKISYDQANVLNKDGYTPFLAYIKFFTEQVDVIENAIRAELQYAEWKSKQNFGNYEIKNVHLFDSTQNSNSDIDYNEWRIQNAVGGVTSYFTEFELKDKMEKTMAKIVTKPFVELLTLMIQSGANPLAKVDKLEFYRELDKHKQKLFLVEETREGVSLIKDAEMKQTEAKSTTVASTTNNVKSRKEVLAERTYEQKVMKNENKDQKGADNQKQKRREMHKQLKQFYASKDFVPRFEKINGKKVEQEYVRQYGLQNSMHLLMRRPVKELFDFLVHDQKVPIDEIDNEGLNPVYISIKSRMDRGKDNLSASTKQLIAMGADFDLADRQGQTPFLHLYTKVYKDAAYYLLDQGANVNAMSKVGVFALKMALIRRNNDDIKELVRRGADINQVDHLGRNLLHEAVKMSSATADATFETEQLIIDLGVKVNQRDQFGRVPLHYAFVKNARSTLDNGYGISTDPIETVSSLCAQKSIEIDVPDKWKKTPLHYASMMGSTISVIYLIQRGASTKSIDIYGNTPLGVAMLYRQFNYAITLIQKNADVKVPVYDEFPNRVDKMWEDEAKTQQKQLLAATQQNVDMTESEHSDDDAQNAKKTRDLFNKKTARYGAIFSHYGSDYGDEYDNEDSSDESEGSLMEKQVYNQNAFGLQNQGNRYPRMAKTAKKASGPYNMGSAAEQEERKKLADPEPITEPKSTFRHAIKNGQQGVAYLILDSGYDYMLAMQDAMDENKFQLVLTLLSKTADDKVIQRKNAKGQNLMHILAQNAKNGNFQILERIYQTLKRRGVDCLAADNQRNNALHFAVQSMSTALVKILIAERIDVNAVNANGHTPLSLYFVACKSDKGLSNLRLSARTINSPAFNESLIEQLARAGADFNHVYRDYKEKPKSSSNEESKDEAELVDDSEYQSTIIINQIKNCDEFLHRDSPDYDNGWNNPWGRRQVPGFPGQQPMPAQIPRAADSELLPTLEYLMRNGATFKLTDSKGRDVMSYAIENNDLSLVKFLISHKASHHLLIHNQDKIGMSAVHYVVNPISFGTYENTHILEELHRAGYRLDLKCIEGMTPLDCALDQSSRVLAAKLQELMGPRTSNQKNIFVRKNSFTPEANWPARNFNPDEDSQQMLTDAEEKQRAEMMEKDKEPDYIPLDIAVKEEKQYKVYYDEEKRPYDCYLTKVDLANGLYGAYLFYKIQLLHDTNRDLYVVLTRYGRIGEVGMNQRSPFNNAADAIADFSTIFKSKTGNEWVASHSDFQKMPKKYNLVHVHHTKVKHEDYLAPFDFESCKPGELSKKVMNFVEEISNVTMYQRAIQGLNVDTEAMPISALKRDTLIKAKDLLTQIKDIIEGSFKAQAMYRKPTDEEYADKQRLAETLGDLSSKFFELIPLKENENQPASPIRNPESVGRFSQLLSTLLSVEFSSRILLGALYRQYQVNPIDYIYDCMSAKIQVMDKKDPETALIMSYCVNTAGQDLKNLRIFRVERKGEAEKFAAFKKEKNRMLLFHGSAMSNYLGILSQGLRIAPPEAPATGYMFGKGVYFADMFKKSDAYSHGITSKVLILCEVALGEMQKMYEAKYIENLERPFLSVKGCGRNGPDLRNKLVITPAGYAVPSGLPMKYPDRPAANLAQVQANPWLARQQQQMGGYSLMHNEYVVYNTDQIRMRYLIQVDIK